MSASSRAVAVAGGLCTLVASCGGPRPAGDDASGHTTAQIGTVPTPAATFVRTEPGLLEVRRIQGHLLAVERALRSRGTEGLNAAQLERRNTALNWLREYRERGQFPHNHTHDDGRVPVFVDEHGTPCAVAYLLQRSGRESLVSEVASTENNVYAWELADDPRFSEWLDETGLTLLEAARIQPNYADGRCICIVDSASRTWRYVAPFAAGSLIAGHVVNGATQPEAWERTAVGAINGAFAVAHAGLAVNAVRELEDRSIGAELSVAVNSALALVSGYVAWSFLRPRPDEPSTSGAEAQAPTALRSHRPRLLAPSAAWVGGRLGLQVRLVH